MGLVSKSFVILKLLSITVLTLLNQSGNTLIVLKASVALHYSMFLLLRSSEIHCLAASLPYCSTGQELLDYSMGTRTVFMAISVVLCHTLFSSPPNLFEKQNTKEGNRKVAQ